MPDLDMVVYPHCISCEGWERKVAGSRGDQYTVEYQPVNGQYTYTCTCKGYQHHGKCKHIEQVKGEHCSWMQFLHGGEPVEIDGEKRCPECHDEITYMKWGV